MRIKSMKLENFQGLKSFEMQPDGKNVEISGRNGTGKTTVYNAYHWLLFNKPGTDEKNYSPETVGSKDITHSAEIVLTGDSSKEIKLKKTLHKSGKSSKTEYQIDDEKVKQKDYESFLKDICPPDKMRMITREDAFLSETPKEERRKIIIEKAGGVDDAEVIASDEKLKRLPGILDGKSIDSYKKIAKDNIKDLKKESDRLAVLIDAANKELKEPEKSKEFVSCVIDKLKETKAELEAKKNASPNEKQAEICKQIAELEVEKSQVEYKYQRIIRAIKNDNERRVSELQNSIFTFKKELNTILIDKDKTETEKRRAEDRRQELIAKWQKVNAMQFDESGKCPYCGQELPPEKIEEARKEYNVKKSTRLEEITRAGKEVSLEVIETLENAIGQMCSEINGYKEEIAKLENDIKEIQREPEPEPFQNTDERKEYDEKIKSLRESLISEKFTEHDSFEQELFTVENDIKNNMRLLLEAENYEKKKAELEDMESKHARLAADCEEYEFGIHLCKLFSMRKSEIMEEKVNSMFENVHFRLFRELVNGEVEEDCEPLVKCREVWIPYSKANHAAKVRAGLEVVQGLSEFFGVNMPVFVDNAESIVTDFPETSYQQVRLRAVKGVEELRCEYER